MDIERLTARNKDGIAYLVNVKPDEQEVDSPHKNTLKCILDCFERLAQYEEEAIARQSEKEKVVCPDCGGSGVYQEYDEYDRYTVHECATCDGSGEIYKQSATSEEVADAISHIQGGYGDIWQWPKKRRDTIITALQAYQFPSAIQWTGKNLREIIDLIGWNKSASSKWTWEEYEQVVKEKGIKIFTPDGAIMADIGDWIISDGKNCYVTERRMSDGY